MNDYQDENQDEVIEVDSKDTDIEDTDIEDTDDKTFDDDHSDDYEDICYVCRRPESKAGKMIHLPVNNICVCQDCMQRSFDSINQGNMNMVNMDMEELMKLVNMPNVPPNMVSFFAPPPYENMTGKSQRPKKKKAKDEDKKPALDIKHIPAPHKIKAQLDEFVIGQEYAKKVISVAVYNHYKRVATNTMDEIEIEKSNMLMIGPTGSGKTYLVRTLARLLDVPLAIADATSLTEAGYIGDDIESVVSKLLAAADNDVERAERGIIFIDEIDKIAKKKNTTSRDVSGESVQQGLLIGFIADLKDKYDNEENILSQVTIEDLRAFGMIPEFIGRLPSIFTLKGLSKEMLVQILKEPKNAIIKQYQKLLALDEVELKFDDDALEAIAEKALEKKTGARALRSIIEEFMLDIMYEIPKDDNIGTVTITRDYIEKKGGPVITMRGAGMIEG